jgi:nucleoside-diphosphate-sugar epimerase
MRVLIVGASGAVGARLVPQLIARGHAVIGTCRSHGNAERVRTLGAEPIALDLLDPHAVREAVREVEPDAIVNQATALTGVRFSKNLDRSFEQTNRLRRGHRRAPGRSTRGRCAPFRRPELRQHAIRAC